MFDRYISQLCVTITKYLRKLKIAKAFILAHSFECFSPLAVWLIACGPIAGQFTMITHLVEEVFPHLAAKKKRERGKDTQFKDFTTPQ